MHIISEKPMKSREKLSFIFRNKKNHLGKVTNSEYGELQPKRVEAGNFTFWSGWLVRQAPSIPRILLVSSETIKLIQTKCQEHKTQNT